MSDAKQQGPRDGRRGFFRQAFLKMAGPMADAVENALPLPSTRPRASMPLRPPGAVPETVFLATCFRSGNCMDACPAGAIRPLEHDDPNLSGTPTIVPSLRACVLCDDLACMDACPSGALEHLTREAIRIGLAVLSSHHCERARGNDCTECITHCPIGDAAIGLDTDGVVDVRAAACTGCGMCEEVCPTTPKAIRVFPYPADEPELA